MRVPHPLFWPHKSFTQQGRFFLIWYSVIRWPMYQMKSTDISIIIIIEMYRKRQNHILRTVLIVFLILTSSALKVDLCFVKKIEILIICHLIFNKKEIWTKVILKLFIAIVVWVFNNLGLKMYNLWGFRVPLNIPHFKNFAATINFYSLPINVPGIFSCHMHISDLCHFLGQANSKTSDYIQLNK